MRCINLAALLRNVRKQSQHQPSGTTVARMVEGRGHGVDEGRCGEHPWMGTGGWNGHGTVK